jgi:crossover junction endodeoxyribonuclease RuvC
MKNKSKIILGIDPGTVLFGYGVIEIKGNQLSLISLGTIELNKLKNQPAKLEKIFERVCWLVEQYHPDDCAIEAPFYGKNPQSMLKLGRAQGVAIAAALAQGLHYEEYSPRRIKQSITGNGNASKEQVAAMLMQLLNFKEMPKYLDSTDGLAVAMCHYFSNGVGENNKSKSNSWKAFVSENPKRAASK